MGILRLGIGGGGAGSASVVYEARFAFSRDEGPGVSKDLRGVRTARYTSLTVPIYQFLSHLVSIHAAYSTNNFLLQIQTHVPHSSAIYTRFDETVVPGVQAWNADFPSEKTRSIRKYGKKCFIQSMFHRFSIFRTICEYHASKNLLALLRTIDRAIFLRLRTDESAAQQVRDPSMQTSGNRKEPNLASKPHGSDFPAECF